MKIGKAMRLAAAVMFAWMVMITAINSSAPSTAAATPVVHHQALADGFIGTLSKYFMAGYDWVEDNVMYYTGKAGGWVYDHTNPCTTQNCNH